MESALGLIDVLLHLNVYLGALIAEYGFLVYGFLFVVIFLETGIVVAPFLPGDSLLFAAGAVAAQGSLGLLPLLILCLGAAVLGDAVNYWVGRIAGERLLVRFPTLVKPRYIAKTHAFFERYGGKTVVLSRFVPIVRTVAPFLAGTGEMSYASFPRYNVLGACLWVFLLVPAGYYFSSVPFVEKNFSFVLLVIVLLSVMPATFELYRNRKGESATRPDST